MAEGDRVALEEQRGEGAVDEVHVGQAHPGRLDLDQHLPRAGLRAGHLFESQGAARDVQAGGEHLRHDRTSSVRRPRTAPSGPSQVDLR